MSRFDELNGPKKEAVFGHAVATVGEVKGSHPAYSPVHLRAREIANNPEELSHVLRAAGIPSQNNRINRGSDSEGAQL